MHLPIAYMLVREVKYVHEHSKSPFIHHTVIFSKRCLTKQPHVCMLYFFHKSLLRLICGQSCKMSLKIQVWFVAYTKHQVSLYVLKEYEFEKEIILENWFILTAVLVGSCKGKQFPQLAKKIPLFILDWSKGSQAFLQLNWDARYVRASHTTRRCFQCSETWIEKHLNLRTLIWQLLTLGLSHSALHFTSRYLHITGIQSPSTLILPLT